MARLGHLHRQGGGEIVCFAARRGPAADPRCSKAARSAGISATSVSGIGAAGFVLRQALVAPAVGAILIIEHRHRVGGLTVDDQLLQGMQAGIDAG